MTVYLTADELLEIEQARLELRREPAAVDRGRLVASARPGARRPGGSSGDRQRADRAAERSMKPA